MTQRSKYKDNLMVKRGRYRERVRAGWRPSRGVKVPIVAVRTWLEERLWARWQLRDALRRWHLVKNDSIVDWIDPRSLESWKMKREDYGFPIWVTVWWVKRK